MVLHINIYGIDLCGEFGELFAILGLTKIIKLFIMNISITRREPLPAFLSSEKLNNFTPQFLYKMSIDSRAVVCYNGGRLMFA
jgi:hypothetical protein